MQVLDVYKENTKST